MGKPKIRFKGYTDEWEQRKLPEFVSFFNGLTYTPDDVKETGTLVLRSSNVKNGEIVDADNVYVNDKVATSENVQKGDIIVVVRNGSRALIGKHAQIKASMPNTVIGAFMSGMRSEHSSFVNALLDTSAFENEIAKNMGATINQITGYMFSKMEFMIPSGEEQQQIGECFQSLDHLITLHQRKYEETQKLKKYMLQKMFPQNGRKVPEIRFSGFTEEWEQRKLDDIAEFSKGSGYSKGDLIESGTPIILYGRLYTKYETSISDVDTFVEAKDGSVYSKGGEVIVPASGETAEDIARAATVDKSGILLGGDLNVVMPNEDINSAFLAISISNGNSQRELAKKAQGKSVVHIHNEEIRNLVVPFPTRVEQNKIVTYFSDLDHLITLHQCKLYYFRRERNFDWEQRKFADFTWDAGKRNKEDLDLEPYAITNEHGFIRQCDAHDDFGYMKDTDIKAYNIVQPNSFAYNPARINVGSIGYYKGVENVIVSSLYEVFQTDNYVNDRFLWHWFKSDEFPRWIERLQEGSVRLYFYYDKLCECQIYMPSLEEQEKIASFLDALDHLITLHQRQLNNLKKLKNMCLKKMLCENNTKERRKLCQN